MTLSSRRLLLGHSPDPDDAFMFYALAQGLVDTEGWNFEHILQDIQTLNERALRGELDITAISLHAYPMVAERYALLDCGCSMGDGYGPMVVTREPATWEALRGRTIAVPGTMTTAYLVLCLLLSRDGFRPRVVPFDEILDHVASGQSDAGLVIHEGQLTYHRQNLHCAIDLGRWWQEQTGLPLPLGGNVIRRDLGESSMRQIARILERSIRYALEHRQEAVAHALQYARDMGRELADRFVGMYVNQWTLGYGERGRAAVRELLRRGASIGMVPAVDRLDFI